MKFAAIELSIIKRKMTPSRSPLEKAVRLVAFFIASFDRKLLLLRFNRGHYQAGKLWNFPLFRELTIDEYFNAIIHIPLSLLFVFFSLPKNIVHKDNFIFLNFRSDCSCQQDFSFSSEAQLLVRLCINYTRLPWN